MLRVWSSQQLKGAQGHRLSQQVSQPIKGLLAEDVGTSGMPAPGHMHSSLLPASLLATLFL